MQGSYHGGNTASRPISEVKHRWALLVLTWETSLEPNVTLRFFPFSLAPFYHAPAIGGGLQFCSRPLSFFCAQVQDYVRLHLCFYITELWEIPNLHTCNLIRAAPCCA